MIPFRSCATGILLWLRILYKGNLLAFANTASMMVTPFIPWCYHQHRFWPDVTYGIIWWHITVQRGFVNIFWLAGDVIILSCPITYCWKTEHFSLKSAGNFWWRSSMWEQNYSASYVQQQSILALKRCHMMCNFSSSSALYCIASCVMETSLFLFKCKDPNISCSISGNNHAWIPSIMQLFSESLHHQIWQQACQHMITKLQVDR